MFFFIEHVLLNFHFDHLVVEVSNASLTFSWCMHGTKLAPVDFIRMRLFPFNPKRFNMFIVINFLQFLVRMIDYSPHSAVSTMVAVITTIGREVFKSALQKIKFLCGLTWFNITTFYRIH